MYKTNWKKWSTPSVEELIQRLSSRPIKSKKEAQRLLFQAGIIDKKGNLTPPYRP